MGKQKTTSFQPDPDVLSVLKDRAEKEDRSVSWLINHYLKKVFIQEGFIKTKDKKKD